MLSVTLNFILWIDSQKLKPMTHTDSGDHSDECVCHCNLNKSSGWQYQVFMTDYFHQQVQSDAMVTINYLNVVLVRKHSCDWLLCMCFVNCVVIVFPLELSLIVIYFNIHFAKLSEDFVTEIIKQNNIYLDANYRISSDDFIYLFGRTSL